MQRTIVIVLFAVVGLARGQEAKEEAKVALLSTKPKPALLSMKRAQVTQGVAVTQSVAEQVSSSQDQQNMLTQQLTEATAALAKERAISNELRERQSESVMHAGGMITDMQHMMNDEHDLRLSSQQKISQIQLDLQSVSTNKQRVTSQLARSQEALAANERQRMSLKKALDQAHLDIELQSKKLQDAAQEQKRLSGEIDEKVHVIEETKQNGTAQVTAMQQDLDKQKAEEKHKQEEHEAELERSKMALDKLAEEHEQIGAANEDLASQVEKQNETIQDQAKKNQAVIADMNEQGEKLGEYQKQVGDLQKVEQKYSVLSVSDRHLKSVFLEQSNGFEDTKTQLKAKEQELHQANEVLTKLTEDLQEKNHAKSRSDSQLEDAALTLQHQKLELQNTQEQLAAATAKFESASAEGNRLNGLTKDMQAMLSQMTAKEKELRGNLGALQQTFKAAQEELAVVRAKDAEQLAAKSKDMEDRLEAEHSEEAQLKQQAEALKAQLAEATASKNEMAHSAEVGESQANEEIRKLQAESLKEKTTSEDAEKSLNAEIAEQVGKINNLQATTNKQTNLLKQASQEKAKLAASLELKTKDLTSEKDQLSKTQGEEDKLKQKLNKISSALLKEHDQRLEDWKSFKTKLGKRHKHHHRAIDSEAVTSE